VPYSPPTERPWIRRASSNNAGAAAPIVAWVGSTAIISEPPHIISTEIIMDVRRPCRSAMNPNSQPPSGRMKKPAAKMPAVLRSCEVRSPDGKKEEAK